LERSAPRVFIIDVGEHRRSVPEARMAIEPRISSEPTGEPPGYEPGQSGPVRRPGESRRFWHPAVEPTTSWHHPLAPGWILPPGSRHTPGSDRWDGRTAVPIRTRSLSPAWDSAWPPSGIARVRRAGSAGRYALVIFVGGLSFDCLQTRQEGL
jgi:hypothetical protein